MFLWTSFQQYRTEMGRELDKLAIRLERLDEHGTRGVDRMAAEVAQLRKDVTEHEQAHEKQRQEQVASRRWLVGIVVALVIPLYPLLGWGLILLARTHG
jgi:hypothetical protein